MIETDIDEFVDLWATATEISVGNKQLSDNAVNAIFETLIDYNISSIKKALLHHGRINKFPPTPRDIIEILNIGNKRISADEAWAICPSNSDETVVWNEDIAAAYTVACNLLNEGDKVAARMTFKSAYNRICEKAEVEGRCVRWTISLGFDKLQRESVIKKAVMNGFITQNYANKLLPSSMVAGPIGKLLTGKTIDFDKIRDKKARLNLREISNKLKNR